VPFFYLMGTPSVDIYTSSLSDALTISDKLKLEFKAMKRDSTRKQTDKVLTWTKRPHVARSGKETWKIDVVTDYRSFSYWVMKHPTHTQGIKGLEAMQALGDEKPDTITYQLDPISTFFRVFAYNRPADVPPE